MTTDNKTNSVTHDPQPHRFDCHPSASNPLLTESQGLLNGNNSGTAYPDACVHELFEQQVARTPDAFAVVSGDRRLTYRDINQRANLVAHHLRKRGTGPEDLVGVCMERTPEMVIALLGVWKAGAAYVPLDPAYPEERLSFMVQDAAVRLLLTEEKCKHLFSSLDERAICIDSDWPVIAQESDSNPNGGATPANLAYVMYTSGSTGKPKGAMIVHRGLVNYLWWAIKAYGVSGGSVPVHSSISFDLTVTSLYPALLSGGQVELLAEDTGAQSLLAALRKRKNRDLVKITPAHLELLNGQLTAEEAAGMSRAFVIGGESLLAESLRLWREASPATRLINEYGPTETVVGCCVYEVQPNDPYNGPVPIGRPIANTQIYILGENLQPLPQGVVGELYIGGDGVARGYLNRPELTRERFLSDPFSGQPEAHMYKTGDLGRYRKDGIIEYLGRADNQVKLRGYRIELGEIEATIASHPAVQCCAVLAREDTPGDQQLVAYVVARRSASLTAGEVRNFAAQTLPEYMVPPQFVFLESLPLTANGKVDREALPPPTTQTAPLAGNFVSPRTETEKSLAAIWSELLKVERVGIHDDFFDLGGHSLIAIRAVSRIRDVFGVDLPLAALLEAPTVADLARLLGQEDWKPSWSLLVPIRAEGSKLPLFLMHAHGGNVLEYHALVRHLDHDQPVYGFQAKGLDGEPVKGATVEKMAAAFLEELRSFQPHGPYFLGGFCLGGLLALETAQQLVAAGEEVKLVIVMQSIHPECLQFKSSTSGFQRWRYRAGKRVSLEVDNFSYRGAGYVPERTRQVWDLARMRIRLAFDSVTRREPVNPSLLSKRYIYETLSIEHKKAMLAYRPRPYDGDVALFRASEQLSGLVADGDEYLGWKRSLLGNLQVSEIRGHQQNILLEPNVRQLAKEISACLNAAQQALRASAASR